MRSDHLCFFVIMFIHICLKYASVTSLLRLLASAATSFIIWLSISSVGSLPVPNLYEFISFSDITYLCYCSFCKYNNLLIICNGNYKYFYSPFTNLSDTQSESSCLLVRSKPYFNASAEISSMSEV